ncbi:alpha/beta fold hydrolase [Novosphingobium resinovorum]|uniref:AB hydrolase-1 domain-containing protein n=1 Tax=Novosphingobium resinovorum TaxID=158500 RepID=A0A1D8A6M9_9SPHN|nr:alpha/beta fold hydrolase [Novosphingobium resinovorum]AOR77768.1 hypothetical protein BES08_14150 [Novosphingobium resinovorum]
MPYQQIEDTEIHYRMSGSGPALLLLHSLGGSVALWDDVTRTLSKRFTVVSFDARGHGDSPARGEISVQRFARDGALLCAALGIDRFIPVGLSMGGHAAMQIALDTPARVRGVIIADSSAGGRPGGAARVAQAAARIAEIGADAYAVEYSRSRLAKAASEAAVRAFADLSRPTIPDVFLLQLTSIQSQDWTARLGAIRAPTLVIVGDEDSSTPVAEAARLRDMIAGANMAVIEGAGHLSVIDKPEAFGTLVANFASSIV